MSDARQIGIPINRPNFNDTYSLASANFAELVFLKNKPIEPVFKKWLSEPKLKAVRIFGTTLRFAFCFALPFFEKFLEVIILHQKTLMSGTRSNFCRFLDFLAYF